jgi:outer membrane lipoprotein-sorting protein
MRILLFLCLGGLPGLATTISISGPVDAPIIHEDDTPPAGAIIQETKAAYAALQSYSDSGTIESQLGGFADTMNFTIRVQRPGLYRISWKASAPQASGADDGMTWSDGTGDFLGLGGMPEQKQKDRATALAGATGTSLGAAANIPGTFFGDNWGNQLVGNFQRQPDETVDGTDCYVVSEEMKNGTSSIATTLWIGKQDHFIRRIRTATRGTPKGEEGMPQLDDATLIKILESQNQPATPDAIAALRKQLAAAAEFSRDTTKPVMVETVESHSNIVANKLFSPGDFKPESN